MFQFVQPLEQRTLFAATGISATLSADLSTIHADAKTVRADLHTVSKTVGSDVKTIQADLKGSGSSNNKLLVTLRADDARSLAKVTAAQERYLDTGQALSAIVTAEGKLLAAHSNSNLRSHLASQISKLNSTVADNLATLQAAVNTAQTTFNTDVQAIAAAGTSNPTLATDATTAKNDFGTTTGTYLVAANTFKTDTGTLATDAGTI
jgi:paraquat-inducible protein B